MYFATNKIEKKKIHLQINGGVLSYSFRKNVKAQKYFEFER